MDEKRYEQVGNIRIKEPKKKKNKKKSGETSVITKIFVWFMVFAMLVSSVGILIYYLYAYGIK